MGRCGESACISRLQSVAKIRQWAAADPAIRRAVEKRELKLSDLVLFRPPEWDYAEPLKDVTDDQESRLQGVVDSISTDFYSVVSQSRGLSMDDVATWGDGGYWTAEDGLQLKLVDRICDWTTFLSQIIASEADAANQFSNQKGGDSMSNKFDAGSKKSKTAGSLGNKPHAQSVKNKVGQSASDQWNEAIAEKMTQGLSREKAVKAVVSEQPELHEAYLKEFNAKEKANR